MTVQDLTASGGRWRAELDDSPVAIATSANRIAVLGAEGRLLVLSDEGEQLGRAELPLGGLVASWSSDGTRLALGGPTGAALWSEASGLVGLGGGGWCGALAWAPDGRLAVAADRQAQVIGFDASGDAVVEWTTAEVGSTITGLAWLRDGRELAVAGYGGVRAFSRNRTTPARTLGYAGSLLDIAVSPDGRWLVSGNQDASVHIWRLRDASELEMSGYPSKVGRLAFDASGRWLVADGGGDPTVWDFSGAGPRGRRPAMLALGDGLPGSARFAWHGEESVVVAATEDGRVGLWDPARLSLGKAGGPQVVLIELAEPAAALGWLTDAVVVATAEGQVLLLDR